MPCCLHHARSQVKFDLLPSVHCRRGVRCVQGSLHAQSVWSSQGLLRGGCACVRPVCMITTLKHAWTGWQVSGDESDEISVAQTVLSLRDPLTTARIRRAARFRCRPPASRPLCHDGKALAAIGRCKPCRVICYQGFLACPRLAAYCSGSRSEPRRSGACGSPQTISMQHVQCSSAWCAGECPRWQPLTWTTSWTVRPAHASGSVPTRCATRACRTCTLTPLSSASWTASRCGRHSFAYLLSEPLTC